MPEAGFNRLRAALEAGGVAQHYVERTLEELADHYSDLEADAIASGCSSAEAARRAREALGTERSIAAAVLARTELRDWAHHWPRAARYLGTIRGFAVVSACPVRYLAAHGGEITRWSVSAGLATLMTSGLLLTLQSLLAA